MDALTSGGHNVAIGVNALGASTTGCRNIAIGNTAAGGANQTGVDNVALGTKALLEATGGDYNIAIGSISMCALNTGCHNIAIGEGTGISVTSESLVINIGCRRNKSGADQTCLGGAEVFLEGGAYSDCRAKCCIVDSALGLDFINALKPRSFKWINQPDKLDEDGNIVFVGEHHGQSGRTHYGLIAQEVKAAVEAAGINITHFAGYKDSRVGQANGWVPPYNDYDPDGTDYADETDGYEKTLSLRYEQFSSPIIKAIQELDDKIVAIVARVTDLE